MIEVVRIPVLSDNYVWLVHEPDSGETMVVDPAVAEPVLAEAEQRGWRIGQIWNTHWHPDHTGGNQAIKDATGCTVTGPAAEAARIPTLDRQVAEGDVVRLGGIEAVVMEVPAHTAGHIAYHLPSQATAFVGDTLFAMGCGRLFEGSAEQMYANLQRLAALPPETVVYPAHEYTLSNGRFALTVDPDNQDLRARMVEVEAARAAGEPTVPTTIAAERATNPFIRASSAEAFARLRKGKDEFRG
ncbi:MAG: hydroxyacylglutathione hydrolase [Allosphingosinicella sp.]|uniref:hydroxyacylglutathione hydrolase n=1 Tax=Allosphingosinicella sp. TaxID=2823234 RepID=UPI00393700AD